MMNLSWYWRRYRPLFAFILIDFGHRGEGNLDGGDVIDS